MESKTPTALVTHMGLTRQLLALQWPDTPMSAMLPPTLKQTQNSDLQSQVKQKVNYQESFKTKLYTDTDTQMLCGLEVALEVPVQGLIPDPPGDCSSSRS